MFRGGARRTGTGGYTARLMVTPNFVVVLFSLFVVATSRVDSSVKQVDGEIDDRGPEPEDDTEHIEDGEGKSCAVGMVGAVISMKVSVKPRSALPMPSFGDRGESEWKRASRSDGGMTAGEAR